MNFYKNVIFIGGNLYPYKIGGYEVFNYYFSKQLSKDYKVEIWNRYPLNSEYEETKYQRIFNLKPAIVFDNLQYFVRLLLLKNKKNNIIILTYAKSRWLNWWIYPLLKTLTGTKYIVIIHGGGITAWDWTYLHKIFLLKAKHVVGVSERICAEYHNRTGKEISFIPPLIPYIKFNGPKLLARERFNFAINAKVILIVGTLKSLKNPHTILKAARILGIDFIQKHSLSIVFAGGGILKPELLKKAEEYGIDQFVTFLGNVSRDEVPVLYKAADIFVMGSDYEGTPLSLIEAMHNSLIVVGSNAPGINHLINNEQNGFLFETKNSIELAGIISKLVFSSDFELEKIRRNAKRLVEEKFNYEEMLKLYYTLIENS